MNQLDKSQFTGEVEQVAISSFLEEYADRGELERIAKRLNNPLYKKALNIYHFLGLSLQDRLNGPQTFEIFLQECFDNQSARYKYLISKIFDKFEESLRRFLFTQIDTQNSFILILRSIYLEAPINKNSIIDDLAKNSEDLDIIDLMLLEDFRDIQSIGHNRLQGQLFDDIRWCATEIQSKHRILNNKEDQYNSLFQSLLSAKGYKVLDQAQRGSSYTGTQYGELDVAVFTKENIPLSILEAFIIGSIDTNYITKHLRKLSENYDPNGLQNNYAVIYSQNNNFLDLWERYKDFVATINFEHKMMGTQVDDITNRFPQFAGIKIGLTKHQNRGNIVQIYHIFMDMNL
ncbi:MAG: hypothetical protein KC423_10015 [Anaerolineales bacterium]|nr:hypothetical protein [Anaerolineales bacterium]